MKLTRRMQKHVAVLVTLAFSFLCLVAVPAQAAMVGTEDLLHHQQTDAARQKVLHFLDRQDVAQHLQGWGLTPDEAKARVSAMTDSEVNLLAQKIDQMPAGGDSTFLAIALGIAVLTFVVLIITDVMGVTDVFPFIKKR